MTDITIARAIHILSVVHWIGGVSMVTIVILPALRRHFDPSQQLQMFETIEGGFSFQAKISVTLAGFSGLYMTHRLALWDRFLDPAAWWLHAMLIIWVIFMLMLFVAEPLFFHDWLKRRAATRPEQTLALVYRLHLVLLLLSFITVIAAVLGAHGLI